MFELNILSGSRNYFEGQVDIPVEHPGHPPGLVTLGKVILYEGNASLKTNCAGEKYNHGVISIDDNWVVSVLVGGQPRNVGKADNERYWDHYYQDYAKVSGIDYSMNCHGYAFGVGDWPQSSLGIIRESSPPHPDDCYKTVTPADWKEVEIASDDPGHSIKITGDECTIVIGDPGNVPVETTLKMYEKTSSEKFRESGVYEQSGSCQNPVNLHLAHSRPGGHGPFTFSFFKKKQAPGGGGSGPGTETPDPIDP
jgi:hypothetical protein